MLILYCILGLQSQSIDFTNDFSHADIPSGEPVFIDIPKDLKSDGGQGDVVIILKKSLQGQDEAARLWYLNFRNDLLDRGFVMRKVDTCLLMSNTVYVDDFLFSERSQSDIDNVMNSFKEDGHIYNR